MSANKRIMKIMASPVRKKSKSRRGKSLSWLSWMRMLRWSTAKDDQRCVSLKAVARMVRSRWELTMRKPYGTVKTTTILWWSKRWLLPITVKGLRQIWPWLAKPFFHSWSSVRVPSAATLLAYNSEWNKNLLPLQWQRKEIFVQH